MNCEEIQHRILEASADERADLTEHVAGCSVCAASLRTAVESDEGLSAALDAFGTGGNFAAAWEAADAQVPTGQRQWVQWTALALAATATLTLAVWQRGPADDRLGAVGSRPVAADHATELHDAFEAIDFEGLVNPSMDREAQDNALRDAMAAKARAMRAAEAAYLELITSEDAQLRLHGLRALGELYVSMGDALQDMVLPTYLDEQQAEQYRLGLQGLVDKQYRSAIERWEEAAELADAQGKQAQADELRAWSAELQGQLQPDKEESPWSNEAVHFELDLTYVPQDNPGSLTGHVVLEQPGTLHALDDDLLLPASAQALQDGAQVATTWNTGAGVATFVENQSTTLGLWVYPTRTDEDNAAFKVKVQVPGHGEHYLSAVGHSGDFAGAIAVTPPIYRQPEAGPGWFVLTATIR